MGHINPFLKVDIKINLKYSGFLTNFLCSGYVKLFPLDLVRKAKKVPFHLQLNSQDSFLFYTFLTNPVNNFFLGDVALTFC